MGPGLDSQKSALGMGLKALEACSSDPKGPGQDSRAKSGPVPRV